MAKKKKVKEKGERGGGTREELTYNVRVYTCYVEGGEGEDSVFILYLSYIYEKEGTQSKNFG